MKFRTHTSLPLIRCLLITVGFVSSIRADLPTGASVFSFAPKPSVGLDRSIDTSTNVVDIVLSRRSDGWFSVGFGQADMVGTSAVAIDRFGLPSEYRLGILEATALLPATTILRTGFSTLSASVGSKAFGFHLNLDGGAVTSLAIPVPFTVRLVSANGVGRFSSSSIAKFFQRFNE